LGSLVAGIAAGVGITWVSFGQAGSRLEPRPPELPLAGSDAEKPRLAVDATAHDFGTVDLSQTVRHTFRISNRGRGVLRLQAGRTTCSACTIAALDKTELGSGDTSNVVVEYKPGSFSRDFRQTATVLSNDPEHPRVELTVSGKLSVKLRRDPETFEFGNVAAGEGAKAELRLFYMLPGELRITDHAFVGDAPAENFSLDVRPIESDKLAEKGASSGALLVLSLKPGLPLGPFSQTIRLTLDTGEGTESFEYNVGAFGTIVSDLTIVGPGWLAKDGVLTLGAVPRDEGLTRALRILVRGDHRQQVRFEMVSVDPPQVQVTLGEPSPLNESVEQTPLEVMVPPGLPPILRTGSPQSPYGEILLKVDNHPHVKELKLRLKLTVE
jgi:hypothetical protein